MSLFRKHRHSAHFLFVGLLVTYILAGCVLVPFHGDEATILYMSRDFDTLFLHGDLMRIEYRDPPPTGDPEAATKQELRILNGVTSKYLYGLAWWTSGFATYDLNQQWIWGADWEYNQSENAIPNPIVLFVARWTSGLLTVLSLALVFVIGMRAGGWRTAYVAAFVYTVTPAVLLNGRRAVFESAMLASTALVIYLAQRTVAKRLTTLRGAIGGMLLLGLAVGLTIASKHTDLLIVAAALCAIVTFPLLTQRLMRTISAGLIASGALVVAALVFLALNTAWWSQPLAMPKIVLEKRQEIISEQISSYGAFDSTGARFDALVRESLVPPPQYYEATKGWPDWIGGQINQYELAGLAGISGHLWILIVGLLRIAGLIRGLLCWRRAGVFVVLCWVAITAIGLYVLTPFDWQRYYLPMAAPVAVLCGLTFMSDRRMSIVSL